MAITIAFASAMLARATTEVQLVKYDPSRAIIGKQIIAGGLSIARLVGWKGLVETGGRHLRCDYLSRQCDSCH